MLLDGCPVTSHHSQSYVIIGSSKLGAPAIPYAFFIMIIPVISTRYHLLSSL